MASLRRRLFARSQELKVVVSKNEQEALIVTLSDGTDAGDREVIVVRSISEKPRPYYEHMYGGFEGGGNWQKRHPIFGRYQGAFGPGWMGQFARQTVRALGYASAAMWILLWLIRWLR
jgi:hypothetical protein